jgi:hypothetical protein
MPIVPGLIANSGGSQPSPPTGIFATTTAINSFTINWTPPAFLGKITPVRYIISLYDSSGSLINANYRTVNHPATSFTVDGLAEGTTYSVRMRLENAVGIFSQLSIASANITTAVTPPPPPPPPSGGGTTWFCTINAVGGGVSNYITNIDETGAICNSYAISCSTSGYPSAPTIPTCTTSPPPDEPSCTASCGSYGSWSSCQNGTQFRTRTCIRTDCTTFTQTQSQTCCTPTCGAWSGWQSSAGGIQERTRTCLRSDCTTYTETEVRCTTSSTTSCGPCSGTRTITQSCTTTTRNSDCTTTKTTFTRKCT